MRSPIPQLSYPDLFELPRSPQRRNRRRVYGLVAGFTRAMDAGARKSSAHADGVARPADLRHAIDGNDAVADAGCSGGLPVAGEALERSRAFENGVGPSALYDERCGSSSGISAGWTGGRRIIRSTWIRPRRGARIKTDSCLLARLIEREQYAPGAAARKCATRGTVPVSAARCGRPFPGRGFSSGSTVGFATPEVFDFLDADRGDYVVAMAENAVLRRQATALIVQARRPAPDRARVYRPQYPRTRAACRDVVPRRARHPRSSLTNLRQSRLHL